MVLIFLFSIKVILLGYLLFSHDKVILQESFIDCLKYSQTRNKNSLHFEKNYIACNESFIFDSVAKIIMLKEALKAE